MPTTIPEPPKGRFVVYYRVSTKRQGESGLGIEGQREEVRKFLSTRGGPDTVISEFTEFESGKNDDRPALDKAISTCKVYGATLVVANLSRLSRNASFTFALRDAKVAFVCCDMPEANDLTIGLMAVIAQHEREMISTNTKNALAAAKARGVKIGGYRHNKRTMSDDDIRKGVRNRQDKYRKTVLNYLPIFRDLIGAGYTTTAAITRELNRRKVPKPGVRSCEVSEWQYNTVRNMMLKMDEFTKDFKSDERRIIDRTAVE